MKDKSNKKELTVRVVTPITKEQAKKIIQDISKSINLKYSNWRERKEVKNEKDRFRDR